MSTEIQVFNFNGLNVREITDRNGNPWFIAKDISDFLGFTDAGQATRSLDPDEKTTLQIKQDGSNYKSKQVLVNESGLYSLILRSKKPESKTFKKWVTSVVLPTIRKTGSYSLNVPKTLPEALRAYADEVEKREKAEKALKDAEPKISIADTALRDKEKQYSITDAGKHIGLHQSEMFKTLRSKRLLTVRDLPTQKALNENVLSIKTNTVNGKNRPQAVMTMENIMNFNNRYNKFELETV